MHTVADRDTPATQCTSTPPRERGRVVQQGVDGVERMCKVWYGNGWRTLPGQDSGGLDKRVAE